MSPPPDAPDRLDAVQQELRAFVAERAWQSFHDPKNLAMAVASEAGELVALLRWVAGSEADAFARSPEHGPKLRAEVADVAIALLLLCDRAGIDLVEAVRDKLEVNRANYPVEASRGRAERPR
ncbi:MAG: nucleotide pyrophosphohydrolase [Myxococcales bacterium]|nr:nucleotide pyrophosphohydrolase [Myxococcales bacterium]